MPVPQYPNIAICGNPGVGKTSLAKKLSEAIPSLKYIDFGKEAISREFHDGWDDELDCHIVDYEAMVDDMKISMSAGAYIIDWIHADFWPLDGLVNLVVTVTCDNTILYDRYKARGYSQAKIDENLDSEIMGEIVQENHDYFGQDSSSLTTLVKLTSESDQDLEDNIALLVSWIEKWRKRHNLLKNGTDDPNDTASVTNDSDSHIRRVSVDEPLP